jgi:hypothetical protein
MGVNEKQSFSMQWMVDNVLMNRDMYFHVME